MRIICLDEDCEYWNQNHCNKENITIGDDSFCKTRIERDTYDKDVVEAMEMEYTRKIGK